MASCSGSRNWAFRSIPIRGSSARPGLGGKLWQERFPESSSATSRRSPPISARKAGKRFALRIRADGLVVKVDEIDLREELGTRPTTRAGRSPSVRTRPLAKTRLKEIVIQVRTERPVTPVRPFWSRWSFRKRRLAGDAAQPGLHRDARVGIGDEVSISKRGDIPAVEEVLEKSELHPSVYRLPEKCPFCSSLLIKDGAHQFCENEECPKASATLATSAQGPDGYRFPGLEDPIAAVRQGVGPDDSESTLSTTTGCGGSRGSRRRRSQYRTECAAPWASRSRGLAALGLTARHSRGGRVVAHGLHVDKTIAAAEKDDWETFPDR